MGTIHHLNDEQEAAVAMCWHRVESALTDDGKSVVEPVVCYLIGIERLDVAEAFVAALTNRRLPHALRIAAAVAAVLGADIPEARKERIVWSRRVMGEITWPGVEDGHLSYMGEESPGVLLSGVPKAPVKVTSQRLHNAFRLADRLIEEARKSVGGPVAWGRMSHDAQIDAVRARAWLIVQAREGADTSTPVSVGDVFAAMSTIYSREAL